VNGTGIGSETGEGNELEESELEEESDDDGAVEDEDEKWKQDKDSLNNRIERCSMGFKHRWIFILSQQVFIKIQQLCDRLST
jgi:hypothetical protein